MSEGAPKMDMVDAVDCQILRLLGRNGRASLSEVAGRAHLSRATVYARVRRMIDAGVIERFSVQIAPERVGLGTSAVVALTITQGFWPDVRDSLSRVPGVEHIALCSGDPDALVHVRTVDNARLRDLVLREMGTIPGVVATRTTVLLEELGTVGAAGLGTEVLGDRLPTAAVSNVDTHAEPGSGLRPVHDATH